MEREEEGGGKPPVRGEAGVLRLDLLSHTHQAGLARINSFTGNKLGIFWNIFKYNGSRALYKHVISQINVFYFTTNNRSDLAW